MQLPAIDLVKLRVELARLGKTKLDVARALNHPVSTLSSWLNGVAPMPADLVGRIEEALGLAPGTLASSPTETPAETTREAGE